MAHITIAVSEQTFRDSFELLRDSVRFEEQDNGTVFPFTVEYDIAGHLEGGSLNLLDTNSLEISELDLRWDRFKLTLAVDIPSKCVGGWCIGGGWFKLCVPKKCFFTSSQDVSFSENLAPLISQEISLSCHLDARHHDASGPAPGPPCSMLRVVPWPSRDEWEIYIDPDVIQVDLFDFAQIGSDLFRHALEDKISEQIPNDILGGLLLASFQGLANLIETILDVPDDLNAKLAAMLNELGVPANIESLLADFFAQCNPIYGIDDPYQILPATNGLVPVRVPVNDVSVTTNDHEMIATATVGE